MNKVSFWPRAAILQMVPPPNSVLISVFDRSDGPLQSPHAGWKEVLALRFHDTEGQQLGLEPFTQKHAEQVFDLLARHPDCTELFVHCAEGRSRSAAIALHLHRTRAMPCFQQATPVKLPYRFANKQVLEVLLSADPLNPHQCAH